VDEIERDHLPDKARGMPVALEMQKKIISSQSECQFPYQDLRWWLGCEGAGESIRVSAVSSRPRWDCGKRSC
jgi:hypothetical protein